MHPPHPIQHHILSSIANMDMPKHDVQPRPETGDLLEQVGAAGAVDALPVEVEFSWAVGDEDEVSGNTVGGRREKEDDHRSGAAEGWYWKAEMP